MPLQRLLVKGHPAGSNHAAGFKRRRASRTEAVLRAAILAAVLTTLAIGLTGALRSGSEQVASRLDAVTHVASVR